MKKLVSLLFVLSMLLCAFAAGAEESPAVVYVTISDGTLVLVQEPVEVTDIDEDGLLTINDALYLAHEAAFEGGAEAGYASANGDWGLYMTRLWGIENGGSYGYYVNDTSAMGLTDAVNSGDRINAFVYTDTASYSDLYCWFEAEAPESGDEWTLTLLSAGYDENWAPVTLPVSGAVITINGEMTEAVTDAEGKVTLRIDTTAPAVISAISETATLVPPAWVIE